MVTDIGLGVVVAVGVLLGLVAGMVVGWVASRRMGRKDFALQSEAIRAESESAVARLNAELIEAQGHIRVLETDRASLQGEKSSAKSLRTAWSRCARHSKDFDVQPSRPRSNERNRPRSCARRSTAFSAITRHWSQQPSNSSPQ